MGNKSTGMMTQHSDAELIKMVNEERHNYDLETLEAADLEVANRDLNIFQPQEDRLGNERHPADLGKASESLGFFWKVLAFFIPGVILILFSEKFKKGGYAKKSKELRNYTLYGFAFYFGILIFVNLLSKY